MKKYPVEQRKIPSIGRDIQILIFHPKTAKKEAAAGVEASVDVDPNWFHAYDMFFVQTDAQTGQSPDLRSNITRDRALFLSAEQRRTTAGWG